MLRLFQFGLLLLLIAHAEFAARAEDETPAAAEGEKPAVAAVHWFTDYGDAVRAAKRDDKMLLLVFQSPGKLADHFEHKVLAAEEVQTRLAKYICLKLPIDTTLPSGKRTIRLIDHSSMAPLEGAQGVIIVDYQNKGASHYGSVVGAFPFTDGECHTQRQMVTILDLPPGSRAERTALYVQRMRRPAAQTNGVRWLTDYAAALDEAKRDERMLLVHFYDEKDAQSRRLESETLADSQVQEKLGDFVCVRVPREAQMELDDKPATILKQPQFKEMLGRPGVAILDFANRGKQHHSDVVSAFPLTAKLFYTPQRMLVVLDLPPGTLTQRTMVYAVRTHYEKPKSTNGQPSPVLLEEAERHSQLQANIRKQGHHNWDSRFHLINRRLPAGVSATEVCAESWPGENLVEAAVECVRCWRTSSGHWGNVRAGHPLFGYDMKRGANGVWYATGIFGRGVLAR